MINLKRFALAAAVVLALSACGQRVEVAPAQVGKVMTRDGYQEGVIPTSRIRLAPCFTYCDNLVTVDTADVAVRENMTVFMPEDRLNLTLGVQVTLSVNPNRIEPLFNALSPTPVEGSNGRVLNIPWSSIYNTYAKQVILTETREFISQYSIGEVSSSLENMNDQLRERLQARLEERTPFNVRYVGITDIGYPEVITNAQQNAAERRERIQQEEAQLQIRRVELERELEEARLQRQIDIERAEAEAHAQRIQREAVDARVLELRRLENERMWIEKWNGQVPRVMTGDQQGMLLQLPAQE